MPERRALEVALADQKLTVDALKNKELPKGELLIARIGEEPISQNFKLCYAFDIRDVELTGSKDAAEPQRVYVDATTGQAVRRDPLIYKCFHAPAHTDKDFLAATSPIDKEKLSVFSQAPLVASTFVPRWGGRYGGNQTFETEASEGRFRLSHQNGALLTRRDVNSNGQWFSNPDVLNGSTNWEANAQNATTAHWLTQRVHQFYQQFSPDQNGYNRNGAYPRILVDYNVFGDQVNAFWNRSDQLAFGFAPINATNDNPNFSRTLVTADILGHEYTHAVTQNNANLEYRGESGALNESISDIFGTAFERFLFPNNWNWDLAEDSYQIRDMASPRRAFPPFPPLGGQPEIFQGTGWQPITGTCDRNNDFCGVHINSGVMNKWFHTLCTGQGPNGQGTVAINFDEATSIVYRVLRYYLQSTSNYQDAREGTYGAAGFLYGVCSTQQRAVSAAWAAVGLARGQVCEPGCDYTISPLTISNANCNQPITLTASCNGVAGFSCNDIAYNFSGPNVNSTQGSPSVTITAPSTSGTYTYYVSAVKSLCAFQIRSTTVNVNCGNATCDFSSGPRYVGTWYGLTVQIRSISGKNVLVTAISGSPDDKYYPRGDNFWGSFDLDPNAANLQGCLNAGGTGYGGLVIPSGINPPSGYQQGFEQDGAAFYSRSGTPPTVNPCDFNTPRQVGTWNGLNVQIRQFANNKRTLVTHIPGSSNDKYFPRGDNFWDNFTKNGDADQYRPCLNTGITDWYGLAFPDGISPPSGYQQGTTSDGAVFFSTNGARVGAETEPTPEAVALVRVRPNPAQDEVTVTFLLKEAGSAQVRLLDLQGRVQQQHTYKGVAGQNERVLRVGSLASGLYAVEVSFEGQRIIQKLVKE